MGRVAVVKRRVFEQAGEFLDSVIDSNTEVTSQNKGVRGRDSVSELCCWQQEGKSLKMWGSARWAGTGVSQRQAANSTNCLDFCTAAPARVSGKTPIDCRWERTRQMLRPFENPINSLGTLPALLCQRFLFASRFSSCSCKQSWWGRSLNTPCSLCCSFSEGAHGL